MKNRKSDIKGMVLLAVLIAACTLPAVGCSSDAADVFILPSIDISRNNTNADEAAWKCDGTGYYYTIKEDVQVIGTSSTGKTITFDIQNGATVVWTANTHSSSLYNNLVELTDTGDGTFQVLSGEIIQEIDGGYAIYHGKYPGSKITIEIKGGKVSKNGKSNHTICAAGAKVIVSGGTVSASGGNNIAIYANGDVIVSGGTIETNGNDSIALGVEDSSVSITLSGGTAKSSGVNARAIDTNCNVTVNGIVTLSGRIFCNGITVNSGGTLTVLPGTVLDIWGDLTNNGIIANAGTINIYNSAFINNGTVIPPTNQPNIITSI